MIAAPSYGIMFSIAIFVFIFLHFSSVSGTDCLRWYENHQICSFCPHSTKLVDNNNINGRKSCHDAQYVSYFKQIQDQPPSPYHQEVADVILSLYTDLMHLRKPAVLVNEVVPPGMNYLC